MRWGAGNIALSARQTACPVAGLVAALRASDTTGHSAEQQSRKCVSAAMVVSHCRVAMTGFLGMVLTEMITGVCVRCSSAAVTAEDGQKLGRH